jgi:radical SAM superfamily enzyme YgiQ (UPF0313 family)
MKILLIEPAKAPRTIGGEDAFLYEPLALEYLAAGVSADHDVRILDLRIEKKLPEVLDDFSPDIVGITAYTVHVNTVRRLFAEVKTRNPEILTVVGGHHATVMPEDFLTPHIDLIVRGEGVRAFQQMVRRYEKGQGFEGIPGTGAVRDGQLVWGDAGAGGSGDNGSDLDALPFPDRRFTAQYRQHYYSEWMKPLASIRTSKGCPFRCTFCALWKLTGGRYLTRSPARVVEELAKITEPYVFFADDESLVDAPRMGQLARAILKAKLDKRFFLYGRSDTIARNPDLLALWREAGLERVFVGLEFFRDEDLAEIHKGSTLRDNQRAVEILHDLGIEIYASLIVRPEYTRADFAGLRQYCRDLRLNFATFAVLTPLPGTDFYAEVEDQLITHDYDYFDFIHTLLPTALPLKAFYQEYSQLHLNALGLRQRLSLLRKIPVRDLPGLLATSTRIYGQIRMAYQDYEDTALPAA